MKTIKVMVDVETLSTSHNACLTQVAAVLFDEQGESMSKLFCQQVAAQSHIILGGVVDPATVKFWAGQPRYIVDEMSENAQPLSVVMKNLAFFFEGLTNPEENANIEVWANGDSFDIPVLANAFALCRLNVPWSYNAPRDLRTLRGLVEDLGGSTCDYEYNTPGDVHNAYTDCLRQIEMYGHCMDQLLAVPVSENVEEPEKEDEISDG